MNIKRRTKVMVIPMTLDGKTLLVKDRKHGEWGFVSGGVKRNERLINAANRELQEETSGVFNSIPRFHRRIEFKTWYRPDELKKIDYENNERIISTYYVYVYLVNEQDFVFYPNEEIIDSKFDHIYNVDNIWSLCEYVYEKYII